MLRMKSLYMYRDHICLQVLLVLTLFVPSSCLSALEKVYPANVVLLERCKRGQ